MPLICFTSPKGGVGKTMLAANLAFGFARTGRRVVALDLDPQNALRLHFGLPLGERGGLFASEGGVLPWRAALQPTPWGLHLLPYGTRAAAQGADRTAAPLAQVLREILADPATLLIVDTPAGQSQGLTTVLPFASVVVVPLLADGGSIATLPEIESGRFFGGGTTGSLVVARSRFVLNQVEPQARLSLLVTKALMDRFGAALLGVVGRDEAVGEALASGQPLAAFAPQARATQDLAGVGSALDGALAMAEAQGGPATPLATHAILAAAVAQADTSWHGIGTRPHGSAWSGGGPPPAGSWDAPPPSPPASWTAPAAPPPASWNAPAAPPPASWNAPAAPPPASWTAPATPPPAAWNAPATPPPASWTAPASPPPASWNAPATPPPASWTAPAAPPPPPSWTEAPLGAWNAVPAGPRTMPDTGARSVQPAPSASPSPPEPNPPGWTASPPQPLAQTMTSAPAHPAPNAGAPDPAAASSLPGGAAP